MLAPIVLFVYNRPWHTAQTLDALKKNDLAPESELFIFSDGPKNGQAQEKVFEVRKYLKTVTGFKNITIIEKETNVGLANSVISGVTEIVNQYGKIIVLEDDLLTSPYFLTYMNTALDLYEHEEKVMQISGYMFPVNLNTNYDAVFLPFTSSWGWATWKRAWDFFDAEASGYQILKTDKKLRNKFDLNNSYPYFHMLLKQMSHEIDSWAIRWYWSFFKVNALCLYPKETFVLNIGMDGSGTHCKGNSITKNGVLSQNNQFVFPKEVLLDNESFLRLCKFLKKFTNSILSSSIAKAKSFLSKVNTYLKFKRQENA